MRESAEIIDPLQIAGRDQGGEAVGRSLKAIRQGDELRFEVGDQPGEQRAEGEKPVGLLADLAPL